MKKMMLAGLAAFSMIAQIQPATAAPGEGRSVRPRVENDRTAERAARDVQERLERARAARANNTTPASMTPKEAQLQRRIETEAKITTLVPATVVSLSRLLESNTTDARVKSAITEAISSAKDNAALAETSAARLNVLAKLGEINPSTSKSAEALLELAIVTAKDAATWPEAQRKNMIDLMNKAAAELPANLTAANASSIDAAFAKAASQMPAGVRVTAEDILSFCKRT